MAFLYYFQGADYYGLNRCAPALPLLERALMRLEKAIGPDASRPNEVADRLGRCYMARGRYADAERLFKRGISIDERMPNAAKGRYATDFLRMLAALYEAQGYSDAAKALLDRAGPPPVRIYPKDFSAAEQLIALASEHERSGRHAEAEALYKEELARLEEAEAKAPPTREAIAVLQEKLKTMGWSAEVMEERKTIAKEAWRLQKTLPDNEQVAELRHALGVLYYRQRKFAEAETSLKRALALVDDYPELAASACHAAQPSPAVRRPGALRRRRAGLHAGAREL